MNTGRPTKYKPEYDEKAFKYALLGLTDRQIADLFDTSEQTLNAWKKEYPSFLESLKAGKHDADTRVVQSLYNRAIGYSHKETKVFCHEGMIVTEDVVKHYPPDPVSCIFWLKNRQRANWKDKHDIEMVDKNVDDKELIEKAKVALDVLKREQDENTNDNKRSEP